MNDALIAVEAALHQWPGTVVETRRRPPDGLLIHIEDGGAWLLVAWEQVEP